LRGTIEDLRRDRDFLARAGAAACAASSSYRALETVVVAITTQR
jgi:hypothetical protein